MTRNEKAPPEEPVDYDLVTVTLDVKRAGWEVAEQFAARHGVTPLQLMAEAVEQRLWLLVWLMDQANRKTVS